jgi:general secretion pathway protein F
MHYRVRTLSPGNELGTALVEADSADHARRLIEQRALAALAVEARPAPRSHSDALPLLHFCRELQAMLEAGLSLVESIEALCEKESAAAAREVLGRLLDHLRQGLALSDAAERQPEVFPPLFLGLVRASERSGELVNALARYGDHEQQLQQLRARLVGAALYPSILLAAGAAVSCFLMFYVVPSFASVYRDSGRPMPWLSQLLMDWGVFASAHARPLGMAALAGLGLAFAAGRRAWRSGRLARLLRALPWVAARARLMELARLYTTLGLLIEGGLPVTAAMELAAAAVSTLTRDDLARARQRVESGEPLSQALDATGLASPVALRMLRVGERSGQLGAMLRRCAAFHDAQNGQWLERFGKVVEPALMALIGLAVGLVVVLLYLPIFDLAGALQ